MINKIIVIESLPSKERHTGKELYDDIISRYSHYFNPSIAHQYYFVNSKIEFLDIMSTIQDDIKVTDEIILHVEAHGGNEEMQFGNYDLIKWTDLESILIEINKLCKNKLHLNLATCHGMHIAEKICLTKTAPYKSYISALNVLKPKEILEDNSILYEEIIKSGNIFVGYVNFLYRQKSTQLRIKDIKTVLDYILSSQIMSFIIASPTFDLKIFFDGYLNIKIENNILQSLIKPQEKIKYILDLFYSRFFPTCIFLCLICSKFRP